MERARSAPLSPGQGDRAGRASAVRAAACLFRDPVACFADESAARNHPLAKPLKRHVRRIELWLENGRLQAKGERHDFADRYKLEKVLELLKL